MENLVQLILNNLLAFVFAGIAPILLVKSDGLIKGAFALLEAKVREKYLLQAVHVAKEATLSSWQTIMRSAKKKLADGKIDEREYAEFKLEAKAEAMKIMRKFLEGVPRIARSFLEDKLDHLVEASIPKIKAEQAGVPAINPTT